MSNPDNPKGHDDLPEAVPVESAQVSGPTEDELAQQQMTTELEGVTSVEGMEALLIGPEANFGNVRLFRLALKPLESEQSETLLQYVEQIAVRNWTSNPTAASLAATILCGTYVNRTRSLEELAPLRELVVEDMDTGNTNNVATTQPTAFFLGVNGDDETYDRWLREITIGQNAEAWDEADLRRNTKGSSYYGPEADQGSPEANHLAALEDQIDGIDRHMNDLNRTDSKEHKRLKQRLHDIGIILQLLRELPVNENIEVLKKDELIRRVQQQKADSIELLELFELNDIVAGIQD